MRAFYRLSHTVLSFWVRLNYKVTVVGLGHLHTDRGVILASNHQSNFDPVLIASCIDREVFFLAKKELFRFKPFGWVLGVLNTIAIERGKVDQGAMRRVRRTLEGGRDLIFFPEGSRSKDGRLGPFRKGIGMVSSMSSSPVQPILISGTWQKSIPIFRRPQVLVQFAPVLEWQQLEKKDLKNTEAYPAIAAQIRAPIHQMAVAAGMTVGN